MKIFLTGTDTSVGKTVISSWLCCHTSYSYWKPIQSGELELSDSKIVENISKTIIHKESYLFKNPVSPHLASILEKKSIDINTITLPNEKNLIVEGVGGVLVPLNEKTLLVDFIESLNIPVILVVRSTLGTINHTLLSLEALKKRSIPILGVIMNGPLNKDNIEAIEFYGKIKVIATFPKLEKISDNAIKSIELPSSLKELLET
jgi:dethiobiotin synthetase